MLPQRLIRRSQKSSVASTVCSEKRSSLFSSSAESASACGAQKYPVTVHIGGHSASLKLVTRPVAQGNGKGSKMLGEVYQSQPPWLSSQDIQIGVTVLTAAKEKPCLLPPALCRKYLCCLRPESSWQGAHPDSTEARQQYVPSLNVEGQSLRGCHCAETVGSLSSRSDCVFKYQKIGNLATVTHP